MHLLDPEPLRAEREQGEEAARLVLLDRRVGGDRQVDAVRRGQEQAPRRRLAPAELEGREMGIVARVDRAIGGDLLAALKQKAVVAHGDDAGGLAILVRPERLAHRGVDPLGR
jgi:hypothetical protein